MLEPELAQQLGIQRLAVIEIRKEKLVEDIHWNRIKNRVAYSPAGISAIKKHLLEISPENDPPPLDPIDPAPKRPIVQVRCMRTPRNKRIVLAQRVNDGELVGPMLSVRVKSSFHFIPGLEFNARQLEAKLYVLEGRCPRYRGKW